VDGRSNRRNKAAFSNFFGVVWTRPNLCPSMLDFVSRERVVQSSLSFLTTSF